MKPATDQRLSDNISIGSLTRIFPTELVDAVVLMGPLVPGPGSLSKPPNAASSLTQAVRKPAVRIGVATGRGKHRRRLLPA